MPRRNTMSLGLTAFLGCMVFAVPSLLSADEHETESAAIQARTVAFAKTLEEGNAEKVASFWTAHGEYVRDSVSIRGQKELISAYQKYFESQPKLKVTVESDNVRFLAPSTAIEEGRFVISKNEAESGMTAFSALYVKQDSHWRIAMLKEQADVPSLKDLEWLLGTWRAEGNGRLVETVYAWDHSKAFLRMEYTAKSKEGEETGSQMIGVDPSIGLPRSWLFTGDGGVGEGLWSRDGKNWMIQVSSQRSDGSEMTATNILTPIDKNSFSWQSTERMLDGEPQPDTDVVKVSRVQTDE